MPKTPYREKLLEATKGVISFLGDYLLYQAYFGAELMVSSGHSSSSVWRASERATEAFLADKESRAARQALRSLKSRGLVFWEKGENPKITEAGLRRLKSILPFYDAKRVWDGKIYLVTFDIPELRKNQREMLRQHLKKLGCGMLQLSVWITPYDPRGALYKFVAEFGLDGMILVSDVGKDGSVGGEEIKDLVARVFKLGELGSRYGEFISNCKKVTAGNVESLSFEFLSILADDPQLPFDLLPKDWAGSRAYEIYTKHLRPQ